MSQERQDGMLPCEAAKQILGQLIEPVGEREPLDRLDVAFEDDAQCFFTFGERTEHAC